ncbi:hypothetical protein INR49_018929, partial [Caranx melampygus]
VGGDGPGNGPGFICSSEQVSPGERGLENLERTKAPRGPRDRTSDGEETELMGCWQSNIF